MHFYIYASSAPAAFTPWELRWEATKKEMLSDLVNIFHSSCIFFLLQTLTQEKSHRTVQQCAICVVISLIGYPGISIVWILRIQNLKPFHQKVTDSIQRRKFRGSKSPTPTSRVYLFMAHPEDACIQILLEGDPCLPSSPKPTNSALEQPSTMLSPKGQDGNCALWLQVNPRCGSECAAGFGHLHGTDSQAVNPLPFTYTKSLC